MSNVMLPRLVAALMLGAALCAPALAQPAPPLDKAPDATLKSTPETVVWGYFAADIAPALRIKSGQTVRIDTVSHSGVNTRTIPVTFFGRAGIPADQVLKDAIDIYREGAAPERRQRACPDRADLCRGRRARRHARSAHPRARAPRAVRREQFQPAAPACCPIFFAGLRAKVIKLRPRAQRRAVLARHRGAALAVHGHHGGRAAARTWLISSRPPGRCGGNMDFNKLTIGATLYLPVFHSGAQFFTGDSPRGAGRRRESTAPRSRRR